MEHSLDQSSPFDARGQNTSVAIPSPKDGANKGYQSKLDGFCGSTDASFFSSSLPVMFHEKLNLIDEDNNGQSVNTTASHLNQRERALESPQDMESEAIGNLPDDEEELLAGIIDGLDMRGFPSQFEELEEYDLFSSGGGMELDFDSQESLNGSINNSNTIDNIVGNGAVSFGISNGIGTVAGEHPYGEHPSRTLFVRNINSNVEDSELRQLFEQYGAIRTLYTACKHRGFVMISYYDIRAARSAMRALQSKPLRRRKLDIHFSIPKDNPSDKDVNQGTLVVFNLDASVSNDELRQIFGAYGEVKEIRETPHKRHHKFIEFYDVRAAEAALRNLNRSDIAGKRIKLEPSRPGGARRSLMQQLSQELEQDETRNFRQQVGSPLTSSPPGSWAHFSSPSDTGSFHNINHSPGIGMNSAINKPLPGLAAILPPLVSPSAKVGAIGNELRRSNQIDPISSVNNLGKGSQFHHPHSFPEKNGSMMQVIHYNSSGTGTVLGNSTSFGPLEGIGISNAGSFGHPTSSSGGISTLSGTQFLWGSPTPYSHQMQNSPWSTPSIGHSFNAGSLPQQQVYSYSGRQGSYINSVVSSHHHHVGSAPSGDPSHLGYFTDSPDASFMNPRSLGGMGISGANGSPMLSMGGHSAANAGIGITNTMTENGSPSLGMLSPQHHMGHMFFRGGFLGPINAAGDGLNDRGRNRRADNSTSQIDNKKQYQLDLDKIMRREDNRTTLMIKNIPNKYTSKMLLAAIDENHRGTYDFLYLPIDFKNKCNVGYAFINMISPANIVPFYEAFNGKKWEKFNSEKVASLAYARIQGKAALVTHFQNSSLMNEDKRCRPILFHSEGPEAGDQEPFPLTANLKVSPNESSTNAGHPASPTKSGNSCDDVLTPANVEETTSNTGEDKY
ncbi:protein MEI2-like 2 [Cryptomeria japonica]|uniref:protein MEI2-like 2 n=1 Tax=Cryptomeria japonica TaxID=3369 RepID=UPI0027DA6F15|nr:protein MEI2-like 2 [Cryptomeria japonica]XP_057852343.2 protein MEI2-like 2 [Cryptomeria japonica]